MKLYQFSCVEGKKVDMRQAEAVLRHRPDIIIFEAPSNEGKAGMVFNDFPPAKKPIKEVVKYQKMLREAAKRFRWIESDVYVFDSIVKLWKEGHDVKLYNVDAPHELVRETLVNSWHLMDKPRRRGSVLMWWVYIYLRDKIMAKNIEQILARNEHKKDLTVLVFLQKFHWLNVKFQMSNPTKKQMFDFYFRRFDGVNQNNITEHVREGNATLYKYWKKHAEFRL